jgi:V/A-type H+/Na+-transporting ATPase subunit K
MTSLSDLLRTKMMKKRSFKRTFLLVTILNVVIILVLAPSLSALYSQAQTTTTTGSGSDLEFAFGMLGAGLAIAGACIGAGYAVGKATSSAAAAIVERPNAFGPLLIFAGLAEGLAIYGLLVAFQILSKIP